MTIDAPILADCRRVLAELNSGPVKLEHVRPTTQRVILHRQLATLALERTHLHGWPLVQNTCIDTSRFELTSDDLVAAISGDENDAFALRHALRWVAGIESARRLFAPLEEELHELARLGLAEYIGEPEPTDYIPTTLASEYVLPALYRRREAGAA